MNSKKVDLYSGLFYIFISLLQISESLFPWLEYCGLYFSFLSIYASDKGLKYEDHQYQSYSTTTKSLCTSFTSKIELACPNFCSNFPNLQNAGLLLFSCNLITILLTVFIAYLFISRSKGRFLGSIPSVALWSLAIVKIFLGAIFFQVVGPEGFKATWQFNYNVQLAYGFLFYVVDIVGQVGAAYALYSLEAGVLRTPSAEKL